MTKTFIYNNNLETMYTEEAFKKEYSDPTEWSTDIEEWFDSFCDLHKISYSTLVCNNETDNKELCEEFLDWLLDEYEDGVDFLVFREVYYEE